MPDSQNLNQINESPVSSSKRTKAIRWAGTILALALLIYILSRQGWSDIALALGQVSIWRFLLCLLLMLISRLAVTARWHILLRSAQVEISFAETLKVTFAGLFASNFLPTTIGGDVVRLGGIIQRGYKRTLSIASLFVDRLVGMAGMASALPFIFPSLLNYLSIADQSMQLSPAGYLTLTIHPERWWSRLTRGITNALQRLLSALSTWLRQPGALSAAFAFTWVHQLSLYIQMWLLLRSMGDPLPIWSIAGLWAATYFVTLLPVSVNGLGMQELSATFFFTSVGGISLENSLTLAMLLRVLQTLASLPGALFIPRMLSGESHSSGVDSF